jgi:N-acetylneuraminic acid mutarotase
VDNAVAYDPRDGEVYSMGGYDGGEISSGYVYDPLTQAWSQVASLPQPMEAPAAGFLAGKIYVSGGWRAVDDASSSVYAYDPSTGTWSQAASLLWRRRLRRRGHDHARPGRVGARGAAIRAGGVPGDGDL